jgi:hypothetical protein
MIVRAQQAMRVDDKFPAPDSTREQHHEVAVVATVGKQDLASRRSIEDVVKSTRCVQAR